MLWGFFKKIVVADRLAYYVDLVYTNPGDHGSAMLILATYFFAFQIYCDFSGYSDIAIGTARIMGFELMTNFKQPYFSRSIREFWQRWHISLSTWFRDYLYIPIGGNRTTKVLWWYRNLLITFVVSGFWHGANWTFLVWGGLHGSYLILSIVLSQIRGKTASLLGITKVPFFYNIWKVFVTFHLALFAWIFFRANSLFDAFLIIKKIGYSILNIPILLNDFSTLFLANVSRDYIFVICLLVIMNTYDWMLWRKFRFLKNRIFNTVEISLQFWFIVLFGVFNNQQFIYFQF